MRAWARETLFNVGLPKWRQVTKRLDRAGVIKIDCDVLHTWMSAVIIVTDSPYSYVSNEKGEFQFDGIPAGSYEIEIWHERLGRQSQRIVVRDNGTTDVDVVFSAEKKRLVLLLFHRSVSFTEAPSCIQLFSNLAR